MVHIECLMVIMFKYQKCFTFLELVVINKNWHNLKPHINRFKLEMKIGQVSLLNLSL